jgi:hypothetical protein
LYAYELDNVGKIKSGIGAKRLLEPSTKHEAFGAGMHHICLLEFKDGKKLVAIDGNVLVKKEKNFNLLFFIKYSYLKIWDTFFGNNKAPYYPFNE